MHHHARLLLLHHLGLVAWMELLLGRIGETTVAPLVKVNAVVLGLELRPWYLLIEVGLERLLTLEPWIHLVLELLGLIPGHELIRVLVRVGHLAGGLLVEVLLWTYFSVS